MGHRNDWARAHRLASPMVISFFVSPTPPDPTCPADTPLLEILSSPLCDHLQGLHSMGSLLFRPGQCICIFISFSNSLPTPSPPSTHTHTVASLASVPYDPSPMSSSHFPWHPAQERCQKILIEWRNEQPLGSFLFIQSYSKCCPHRKFFNVNKCWLTPWTCSRHEPGFWGPRACPASWCVCWLHWCGLFIKLRL